MATQSWVAILRLRAPKLAHQEDPPWQLKTPTPPAATTGPLGAGAPAAMRIEARVRTNRGSRDARHGVVLLDRTIVRGVTIVRRARIVRSVTALVLPTAIDRVATRHAPIPAGVLPPADRMVPPTGPTVTRAPRRRGDPLGTARTLVTVVRRAAMTGPVVRLVPPIVVAVRRAATTVVVVLRVRTTVVAVRPEGRVTAERAGEAGLRRPIARRDPRSGSVRADPSSPKTSPRRICPPRPATS